MRWIGLISLSISLLIFISAGVIYQTNSPEELLVGTWEEVSWQYEKCDRDTNLDNPLEEASQNLIIHQSEVWRFNSNKSLEIRSSDPTKNMVESSWYIKGRGNILELKSAGTIEDYQIESISRDSLVIYYNFDLQVKGIAKITFRKLNSKPVK